MKVKYDKEVDVIYIALSDNKVMESDEGNQGVILDYDAAGAIVGIEIMDASKKIGDLEHVAYEVA